MRNAVLFVLVCAVALAFSGQVVFAQGTKPGPEHEMLKELEGTWDAVVSFGGNEAKGIMKYKMGYGGLWLAGDFEGETFGQPFHGRSMDGFDPARQKYVSVWFDSMATYPMTTEGTYDKEKKTMTMTGEGPGMDGKPTRFKTVTETKDKDTKVFTMYSVDKDGKEQQMMTITYKRKG
jgi:hypothetical protein